MMPFEFNFYKKNWHINQKNWYNLIEKSFNTYFVLIALKNHI